MRAYLIGKEPGVNLGYSYVKEPPYDAVVIGSLTLGELLCFADPVALSALAEGMQVVLYTPGLPASPKNRALSASLASRRRELKNWGVVFTDGGQKRVITAGEAKLMREKGLKPAPGAVLTPLAKEILEE
ncbi:MAG: hypothetical protein IJW41_00305 [Oscillospiraceae bacterium]|nr:hypothetical protein [Oscillospiraceae bacterium]